MNNIIDIGIGAEENMLKKDAINIKNFIKNNEKNQILTIRKNSFVIEKDKKVDLNKDFQKNLEDFDEIFMPDCQNIVIKFYSSTAEYLKKTEQYYNINKNCFQSNNFIPKKRRDLNKYDDKLTSININDKKDNLFSTSIYINRNMSKNMEYYNSNYLFNNNSKRDLFSEQDKLVNNDINISHNIIGNKNNFLNVNSNVNNIMAKKISIDEINYPPFTPSNLSKKNEFKFEDLKMIEENMDKEGSSDSSKNSPYILNKIKNDIHSDKNENNRKSNSDNTEYLVEMFGRKGWICILCNNFNYETRVKCNRCGVMKKPKKIINKIIKDEINNKDKNNKKGDWICNNCNNLNYSFRTVCNRCKLPKFFLLVNNPITHKSELNINNSNCNCPVYCFSPSIIVFNNLPNVFIK